MPSRACTDFFFLSTVGISTSIFPYVRRSFIIPVFTLKAKTFFSSGYESARLNGFSIFLFMKRECTPPPPPPPARVTSESVIPSERSVGTHQIDSVAPNPKGITCVCPLCSVLQQHLALISPLVLLLWRQVLCDKFSQASFIKLRAALMWFVLHFLAVFLFCNVQLGRHKVDSDAEAAEGREKDELGEGCREQWWGGTRSQEKGTGLPCHLLAFSFFYSVHLCLNGRHDLF